jgi:DNA-binding NarL/FixJ family response regulator
VELVITLLLADDNPRMLAALVQLLQREFVIVDALASGKEVLAKSDTLCPDIILLDISLGDITGFQVSDQLKRRGCSSRIVFLSVHENPEFIRAAIEIGAFGYVFKSQISRDLVNALHAVAEGNQFFSDSET